MKNDPGTPKTDEQLGHQFRESLKSLKDLQSSSVPEGGVFSDTLPFTADDVKRKIQEFKGEGEKKA